MVVTRSWNSTSSSWALYSVLYYAQLYGMQIVLLTVLSAMTVYRREMSCNHGYHKDTDDDGCSSDDDDAHKESGVAKSKEAVSWDDETAELLLEGAGNYCSGQPLLALGGLWVSLFLHTTSEAAAFQQQQQQQDAMKTEDIHFLTHHVPSDVQVHALSFLHPKDVVSFACASRSCRDVVDKGDSSMILWKTLWDRDYAWIITQWSVGKMALERSMGGQALELLKTITLFDKSFYFRFGQAYLNYVLAGQNSPDLCLVGLHGHIYDITDFLEAHPGSPDTLLANAGKDATRFFEDIGHSTAGRKFSATMCTVVDTFCLGSKCPQQDTNDTSDHHHHHHGQYCGLHPAGRHMPPEIVSSRPLVNPATVPLERTPTPRQPESLVQIQKQYRMQQQRHQTIMNRRFSGNPSVLGPVNAYYDPFIKQWKAWYTDYNLDTVFID